jgi:hypothetical protein
MICSCALCKLPVYQNGMDIALHGMYEITPAHQPLSSSLFQPYSSTSLSPSLLWLSLELTLNPQPPLQENATDEQEPAIDHEEHATDEQAPGDTVMNDTESESEELSAGAALAVPMQQVCLSSKSCVLKFSFSKSCVFDLYQN